MIAFLLSNWKLGVIAATIAALSAYHFYAVSVARTEGKDAAFAAITKQTEEIADASERARARVRVCVASGGLWNSSARQCERAPQDRRN